MVKTDRLLLKYIGKYKIQRIAKIILMVKNNVKGLIHLISKLAVKANNYDSDTTVKTDTEINGTE